MRKFCEFIDKTYKVFFYISAFFLAAMFLVCAYSVFSRFIGSPSKWADELIRFLMVFMAFSGAPYLICTRGDLKVDLTEIFFSHKTKLLYVTRMIGHLILTVILLYLIFPTFEMAMKNMDTTTTGLEWTMGYIYLIMPVSFFFCLIAELKNIIQIYVLPKKADASMKGEN